MPAVISRRRAVWSGLAVLFVALIPGVAFTLTVSPAPAKAVLLACCVATIVAGSLLHPLRTVAFEQSVAGSAAWSLLLALISAAVMASQISLWANIMIIVPLMMAVAIAGFLLERATGLLDAVLGNRHGASLAVLLGLGLAGAAPVWLGPWAEYLGNEQIANAMIWISPLTYLAIMADYDYLRSQWFYMYTPFGGLKYTYPPKLSYSAAYLLLGGSFWLAERLVHQRRATKAKDN